MKAVLTTIWKYREVVLIAAILILIYLLTQKKGGGNTVVQDPLTLQKLQQQIDLNGQLYVTIKQSLITQASMSATIDSLAKALSIKPKYIQGATVFRTKIDTIYKDTGRIVILGGDTAHLVQHHDAWVDISAYAYVNPKHYNLDHIDYKSRDSLWTVIVHKSPLFGKTVDEVIVKSSNPYNTITEGASFKLIEKKPWLVFGAGVLYNPLPYGTPFNIGVFAGFPIITLKR